MNIEKEVVLTKDTVKKVDPKLFHDETHYESFLRIADRAMEINEWVDKGGAIYDKDQEILYIDKKFTLRLYEDHVNLMYDNVGYVGGEWDLESELIYVSEEEVLQHLSDYVGVTLHEFK